MEFIDIGPECFTTEAEFVICYKGNNYYRACGTPVQPLEDGGLTHCVKPLGHPRNEHEDYYGRIVIWEDPVPTPEESSSETP